MHGLEIRCFSLTQWCLGLALYRAGLREQLGVRKSVHSTVTYKLIPNKPEGPHG